MPKIVEQFTSRGVTDLTVEVDAANKFVAKQRARVFTRRQFPAARNVLSPEVEGSEPVQTTFSDLFPETIRRDTYRITLRVFK